MGAEEEVGEVESIGMDWINEKTVARGRQIKQSFEKEKRKGIVSLRMKVKSGVKNNKTGGKRGEDWIFESNKLVTQVKRWGKYSHIQDRWTNVLRNICFNCYTNSSKHLTLLVWND